MSRIEFERLFGGRVLAWIGGLATLLGVVFLMRSAVDSSWFTEEVRALLAARRLPAAARGRRLAARTERTHRAGPAAGGRRDPGPLRDHGGRHPDLRSDLARPRSRGGGGDRARGGRHRRALVLDARRQRRDPRRPGRADPRRHRRTRAVRSPSSPSRSPPASASFSGSAGTGSRSAPSPISVPQLVAWIASSGFITFEGEADPSQPVPLVLAVLVGFWVLYAAAAFGYELRSRDEDACRSPPGCCFSAPASLSSPPALSSSMAVRRSPWTPGSSASPLPISCSVPWRSASASIAKSARC